jgi:hypothetical protein
LTRSAGKHSKPSGKGVFWKQCAYWRTASVHVNAINRRSFAPLYKSLAKLYYVQQDFAKAQDLYFQAIDIYESCGIEHEAGICLMHLGACSEEFIRSRPFQTYLWSLETGSYAGVPEEMSIGIGELGLRLGAVTYDKLAGQRS